MLLDGTEKMSDIIKVLMFPLADRMANDGRVSGIHSVVRAYAKIFPEYGLELVGPDDACDIVITHAGMASNYSDIAMLHGIYFTNDYNASTNEWRANVHVVNSIRRARYITVPSPWVAETLRRDFRREPVVIPHGVFMDEWEHGYEVVPKTVLWAKNRDYDVCDPAPLSAIAQMLPEYRFITTFYKGNTPPSNVKVLGVQPTERMKVLIARCSMVLSTVKETWGILYAEAMASGTPVVTANWGHVPVLVPHRVAGYTYDRNDPEDIVRGIRWTDRHRDTLSTNARVLARKLSWQDAGARVRRLCEAVLGDRGW
jgi:glycosyltransferase involved in cell wall biosynthesis